MRSHRTSFIGRRPRRAYAVILAAFATITAATGCDTTMSSPAVPATCTQMGAQCQLPGGPLGVCQQVACKAGETPPCFVCTSQH